MDKSVTAPGKISPLVGLTVFSADGNKMGTVHSVSAGPDGKATAIRIKTGGFLGFGAKLVAIPEGRFTQSGSNIQLALTADEVSKLPEVQGTELGSSGSSRQQDGPLAGPSSFLPHSGRADVLDIPFGYQGL